MSVKEQNLAPENLTSNPRATLGAWNKYHKVVESAITSPENPVKITPQSVTTGTFVTRLRDAIRGCIAFSYPLLSDQYSHEDLKEWFIRMTFWFSNEHVFIGNRKKNDQPVVARVEKAGFHFESLTTAEIYAFQVLLSSGRLKGPVEVDVAPTLEPCEIVNVQILHRDKGFIIL